MKETNSYERDSYGTKVYGSSQLLRAWDWGLWYSMYCLCLVVRKGDAWGRQSTHLRELFTASKAKGGRSTHVFTVHAYVCSTGASCFLMGPRWLIYPILSYVIL